MKPNPILHWSKRQFWFVFIILLVLETTCFLAIVRNDRGLAATCTKSSAALEWVAFPPDVENIVHDWEDRGVVDIVDRGVFLDYAFILFYSTLLAIVVFRCGRAVPSVAGWSNVGDSLGWFMWIAGALDALENAGILLELHRHAYELAETVGLVARLKWTLAGIGLLFVVFTIILWLRTRAAAGPDPALGTELKELRLREELVKRIKVPVGA
jgi:hypothetical protein